MNPVTGVPAGPASTFFIYGSTRSGKTHLLSTLRRQGRLIVADVEGQVAAEVPDAHTIVMPALIRAAGATAEQIAARLEHRNDVLSDAASREVVVWPCLTTGDLNACLAAIQSQRMGPFASLGIDSLTYFGGCLIAEICGVMVVHKKAGGVEEEAIDPVMVALPDFSGQQVRRSMEMKDWQRYAQKLSEMITGALSTTRRLGMHLCVTALEEKRDIYEGEGQAKRFIRVAQGPLLQGRVSAIDIPPRFMYYLRTTMRQLDSGVEYAAQTQTVNGWPAGVRGHASSVWDQYEKNPNLSDLLSRLGVGEPA